MTSEMRQGRAGCDLTRRGLLRGSSAVAVAAVLPSVPAPAAPAVAARGPLTLAELKELSERALPILQKHFPTVLGETFLAEEGENYHGLLIRCDCPERPGKSVRCWCGHHPLAGTPMTGGMSGYYEPEWDERTTYETLVDVLLWTDKPDTMTDAEWVEALALTGMTPATHAERMDWIEQSLAETDQAPLFSAPSPRGEDAAPDPSLTSSTEQKP